MISKQGWTNFFLGAQFWARKITCAPDGPLEKIGAQNQIARSIETFFFCIYFVFKIYLGSITICKDNSF